MSPLNFGFKLDRTPNLEFMIQGVTIPGMSLSTADVGTPFVRLPQTGSLAYDDLMITMKVNESAESYLEIIRWMNTLGHPETYETYEFLRSDCSVLVMNSAKKPIIDVQFTDAFPVYISPLNFTTTVQDVQYITVDVGFKFTRFYYKQID